MDGTRIIHGNALDLPLEDSSVDLVITSPPYFALRSYRDGDEHYDGQVGSEATPQEFLEALWAATREMVRVLKPTGSIWVNLGDKYAGSGGHNNAGVVTPDRLYNQSTLTGGKRKLRVQAADVANAARRDAPDRYNQNAGGIPAKSLMGLPWRYAIGCVDRLGLILRAEVVWSKPNGLPESVTDRVRRSHEQWFHFTKLPRYFSAVDEIRELHAVTPHAPGNAKWAMERNDGDRMAEVWGNPLGKLPGSVWTIATEPLIVPEHLGLPDHFAAFPQEWPRRIILGWSPNGVCTECGEGRRPVVEKHLNELHRQVNNRFKYDAKETGEDGGRSVFNTYNDPLNKLVAASEATIVGYACACTPYTDHPGQGIPVAERTGPVGSVDPGNAPRQTNGSLGDAPRVGPWREYHLEGWVPPPTRPATVLDPFCGTGTTVLVARALGRIGIGVDLSADYCRLAEWRVFQSGHGTKAERRTWAERQLGLL